MFWLFLNWGILCSFSSHHRPEVIFYIFIDGLTREEQRFTGTSNPGRRHRLGKRSQKPTQLANVEASISCCRARSIWPRRVSGPQNIFSFRLLRINRTFASSIYISAVPQVIEHFHVSNTAALLPFSLFLLGLAFGPVLAAPLSEKYGRTATYMISLPIFALFTLGAGFTQTFGGLVACRLLAGIFASPPLTVGAGTNADLWKPESRAMMTTLFALCPYLGPALG